MAPAFTRTRATHVWYAFEKGLSPVAHRYMYTQDATRRGCRRRRAPCDNPAPFPSQVRSPFSFSLSFLPSRQVFKCGATPRRRTTRAPPRGPPPENQGLLVRPPTLFILIFPRHDNTNRTRQHALSKSPRLRGPRKQTRRSCHRRYVLYTLFFSYSDLSFFFFFFFLTVMTRSNAARTQKLGRRRVSVRRQTRRTRDAGTSLTLSFFLFLIPHFPTPALSRNTKRARERGKANRLGGDR